MSLYQARPREPNALTDLAADSLSLEFLAWNFVRVGKRHTYARTPPPITALCMAYLKRKQTMIPHWEFKEQTFPWAMLPICFCFLPQGMDLPPSHLVTQAETLGIICDAPFPLCPQTQAVAGPLNSTSKGFLSHMLSLAWRRLHLLLAVCCPHCTRAPPLGTRKKTIGEVWKPILSNKVETK